MSEKKGFYLPTILLGLIVAAIFLLAIFTYQVPETERALVLTMGKVTAEKGAGLHLRLPLPFQEVIKYDIRTRTFDGNIGKLEETTTKDQKQVVIGINVFYRIKDLKQFKTAASLQVAEDYLGSQMRSVKARVIGRYNYSELINTDPKLMKLAQIKQEMLAEIAPDVMNLYGLEVQDVNLLSIVVPEKTAKQIANRMKSERETKAAEVREKGNTEAKNIRTEALRVKQETIAKAESEAKRIMAEGDAQAAEYYAVFNQAPELASFLRKLDSMKKILSTKTTLILGTDSTPFNIFSADFKTIGDSIQKAPEKAAPAPAPVKK